MPTRIDLEVEEQAAQAAHGDPDALAALYERYADAVERFIRLRVRDYLLAEDLASTTWERVAKSIRRYESTGAGFPAWLFTIARTTALEHQRFLTRRREELLGEFLPDDHPDSGASTHEKVEARLRSHRLAAAVRSLPLRQRRCVSLRFFVGLSLADTASVMGLNVNAVKQLQHRALMSLRQKISDENPFKVPETMVTVMTRIVAPHEREAQR